MLIMAIDKKSVLEIKTSLYKPESSTGLRSSPKEFLDSGQFVRCVNIKLKSMLELATHT